MSYFCHFISVQNTAANITSVLITLRSSIPTCWGWRLPYPDGSHCFLQCHRDMWGCPSPGLQARHSHAAAETSVPVTNPSLCKTLVHHSLCSLLFSIASLNAGVQLVPLNNHLYWDTPWEVALLLHKSSWKFNTHTFVLFYCFLHPALQKWENRCYSRYLAASFFCLILSVFHVKRSTASKPWQ